MDVFRHEKTRRALIWVALPLVVYTLVALAITWPLAAHLATRAAGAGYGDSYEVTRHVWWAREALLDGKNPFDQPLLAYPTGFTSWVQWSHPLQYIPPALLALVFSPLAAFNLTLLIVLVLNGTTAYWLGMALTDRRPLAALLGGGVFLAFPAMQGQLSVGHLGILTLYPLPLFALCLWRVLHEAAGWRVVGWGAIWFALSALAYVSQITFVLFPLILFAGLYSLFWARWRVILRGGLLLDQPWFRAGVMIGVGGLLMLPFYAPLLTGAGQEEVGDVAETGRVTFSADTLAFVSPSPFGPLQDIGLVPDYAWDVLGTNSAEGSAYLGLIAGGLALLALRRRESARMWGMVALGSMLFSLGPLLKWHDAPVVFHIEDYKSYVTLPWALFQNLPIVSATRTPGRFNLATGLAMSALVSLGASVVLERVPRRAFQIGLAALLGGLILVEYQLFAPYPTDDARQPAYFRQLAQADDVRAVLNIPVNNNLVAKFALYQQTIHHKPLIAGHALRRTPQDPALLAVLGRAASGSEDAVWSLLPDDAVVYWLSQAGADRVIVHKQFADDQVVARLRGILGGPEYEDGRIAAFVVPRVSDPPADQALAGASSAEGWSAAADTGSFVGPFLADSGAWYFASARDQYGDLVFQVAPYRVPRRFGVWLDDHLITGWATGGGEVRLPLWLDAGFHTLRFEALDGCTEYPFALTCWDAPDLSGDCVPLDPPACISAAFGPPTWEPSADLPASQTAEWTHGLRLRGAQVTVESDPRAVVVRLFWESDGPLPDSYALFVHVADPETGEPLAQYDGFPVIETDEWGAGTRWQSDVRIVLPETVPSGPAAINLGWFRGDSRLAVPGGGDIASLGEVVIP